MLVTDPASGSAEAALPADAESLPIRRVQASDEPPLQVSATVRMVQDVNAIDYAVTSLEAGPDTVTISYIDNRTGKESRPHITHLAGGETTTGTLHGGLDRTFQVKACNGNGQCVVTSPIAAQQV